MLRIPARVLMPLILLFCVVGVFASDGSGFESEIWGDLDRLLTTMGRYGPNRVIARLKPGDSFWLAGHHLEFTHCRAHPLAQRKSIDAEELKRETMLLLGTGHCFRDHVLEVCPEFARFSSDAEGIRKSFEGSSLETIKHMVASGMGVTVVPQLSVPPDPGELVRYIREPLLLGLQLVVHRHEAHRDVRNLPHRLRLLVGGAGGAHHGVDGRHGQGGAAHQGGAHRDRHGVTGEGGVPPLAAQPGGLHRPSGVGVDHTQVGHTALGEAAHTGLQGPQAGPQHLGGAGGQGGDGPGQGVPRDLRPPAAADVSRTPPRSTPRSGPSTCRSGRGCPPSWAARAAGWWPTTKLRTASPST